MKAIGLVLATLMCISLNAQDIKIQNRFWGLEFGDSFKSLSEVSSLIEGDKQTCEVNHKNNTIEGEAIRFGGHIWDFYKMGFAYIKNKQVFCSVIFSMAFDKEDKNDGKLVYEILRNRLVKKYGYVESHESNIICSSMWQDKETSCILLYEYAQSLSKEFYYYVTLTYNNSKLSLSAIKWMDEEL